MKLKQFSRKHWLSVSLLGSVCLSMPALGATDNGASISASELTNPNYQFPSDLVPNASLTQQANYAWRLFIAANNLTAATLQDGTGRETPAQSFIASGQKNMLDNPTVFESFYHRAEAYPYYSSSNVPNPPINQPPVYSFQPVGTNTDGYKVTGAQYVNLDENNEIGQNFLYYRESNDPDFPVLFMAKVNSVEVNYVWDKAAPSTQSSWVFPSGVIEVKSAWRRVQDIKNSDPSKYHQAMATYYVGEEGEIPKVVTEPFALIALHVIQKTANYPQFIFSTFEHVDAVTRDSSGVIVDPAYQWTSQDLLYGPNDPTTATPLGAYDANDPGLPAANNTVNSYSLPAAGPLSQGYITVTQPKTILQETNDVNNQVLGLINGIDSSSVWANYRLKGIQAIPTSDETTGDFYLANIVVESSQPGVQLFRGNISGAGRQTFCNFRENTPQGHSNSKAIDPATGKEMGCVISQAQPATNANNLTTTPLVEGQPVPAANVNGGGCQGCHGVAQTALGGDFSFLAPGGGGVGFAFDPEAPAQMTAPQLRIHLQSVLQHRNKQLEY